MDLLIMYVDKTNTDPGKDKLCYKKGYVVQTYFNGRCTEPVSPTAVTRIILCPDITSDQAKELTTDNETYCREKKIDVDALSQADRDLLDNRETITKQHADLTIVNVEG